MRRTILAASILAATLALGALSAAAASTAPKILALRDHNGLVQAGEIVRLSSSENVRFFFPDNNSELNCSGPSKGMEGELETNSATTDDLDIFEASGQLANEQACEGGERVQAFGFPWLVAIGRSGKVSITGSSVVGFEIGPPQFPEGVCSYSTKKLKGVATLNGALFVELSGTLTHKGKDGCTKRVTISSGSFGASTNLGGAIEDQVES